MRQIILQRVIHNDQGTFGVLIDKYEPFCLTGELPWHDNKINISCIPAGEYITERITRRNGKIAFWIQDIPGRKQILMHSGNIPKRSSKGCILIGESFNRLYGKQAVRESKKGFRELIQRVKDVDEFMLVIKEPV